VKRVEMRHEFEEPEGRRFEPCRACSSLPGDYFSSGLATSAFTLQNEGVKGAAGLGFEPRLTDLIESVSIPSWLFAAVQNRSF
jgi:hypothetical protein